MFRAELRWWIWVLMALIVYMIWRAPSAMLYLLILILHGFANVGTALVHGIENLRRSGLARPGSASARQALPVCA
jgi:hypothetical protein